MLDVVHKQRLAEIEQRDDALVGDEVEDRPMLAARPDKAAPTKTSQMVRNPGLARPKPLGKLTDSQLALAAQELEKLETGWIGEGAEVLGDKVHRYRRVGELKRSLTESSTHTSSITVA